MIVIIIMAPKKVAKGALQCGERGNPTGPRPEIVVESVNPADLSTEEVPFDAVGSQQPVGTTATITMADFDDDPVSDPHSLGNNGDNAFWGSDGVNGFGSKCPKFI